MDKLMDLAIFVLGFVIWVAVSIAVVPMKVLEFFIRKKKEANNG